MFGSIEIEKKCTLLHVEAKKKIVAHEYSIAMEEINPSKCWLISFRKSLFPMYCNKKKQ